ncbi:MAG: hypothetical protein IKB05_01075 [Alphaproteobacteria bacterium]|nr:hypothetical protein [Alphaproteobacteria bacterium]
MSKGWDNAMLKKLKALTGKGLSTSEIGKRLGMSKNAIVGKLNRLGWNAKAGGATESSAKEKAKETKKAAPKKADVTKKTTSAKVTATTKKAPAKKEPTKKTPAKATPKKEVAKKTADKKTDTKPVTANAKTLAMHQRIVQHALEMANLKPNQCRWPIGDPDSEHFHFCGETVFVGKPYCYEHCKQAYQFTPPKKK